MIISSEVQKTAVDATEENAGSRAQPPAALESVGRGVVVLSASNGIALLLGGLTTIIAGRILLPVAFGRLATANLVVTWLNTITGTVFLPGLRKIVSEDHDRMSAAIRFGARWHTLASLALGFIFCLLSAPAAWAFGDSQLTMLFLLCGLQVPLAGLVNLAATLFAGIRRFWWSSMLKAADGVLGGVGAVAFLLVWGSATAMFWGLLLGTAGSAALAVAMMMKEYPRWRLITYAPMWNRLRYWTSVSLPGAIVLGTLLTVDMWLVKGILGNSAAPGLYAAAYALSRFPLFMVYGLGLAVFTRVSHAIHHQEFALARLVSVQALRISIMFLLPICTITIASSSELLTFLFSSTYAGAAPALSVMMAAMVLFGLLETGLRLVSATDRPGAGLVILSVLLAAAVAVSLILIPRFGIMGAAWGSVLVFGVGAIAALALVFRYLGALPPLSSFVRCGIGSGIAFALGASWHADGWMVLIKLSGLSLAYLAALVLSRELRGEDLHRVRQSIWP